MGNWLISNDRLSAGLPVAVKFGDSGDAFSENAVHNLAGLIKNEVSLNFNDEFLELRGGDPESVQDSMLIAENLTKKITFAERNAQFFYNMMSGATYGTTGADAAAAIASEEITLVGTAYHKLNHENLSSVVVHNGAATPVNYTVTTDYVVDTTNGEIKRVSGGTITDGLKVYVNYNYNKKATRYITKGGSTDRRYFPMLIIAKKRSGNYERLWGYKVYVSAISAPYREKQYNLVDVDFVYASDNTRAEGDRLYKFEEDYS